jgi:hypothetical protein
MIQKVNSRKGMNISPRKSDPDNITGVPQISRNRLRREMKGHHSAVRAGLLYDEKTFYFVLFLADCAVGSISK